MPPSAFRVPLRLLALGAVLLALAGCVTNAPMDLTRSGRESLLTPADRLAAVRPSLALATREDTLNQMGNTYRVQTGKVLREVFAGGDAAPAVAELVDASLTHQFSSGLTKATVTYAATIRLRDARGERTFTARATAETMWTVDRAAREAVERVALDLARQIAAARG